MQRYTLRANVSTFLETKKQDHYEEAFYSKPKLPRTPPGAE